ncbi:MAG: HAMP domain-containing protein [Nitrospirae bacterium]|nr:HAMP domain-containing protein [Nitrospirota bacterium]
MTIKHKLILGFISVALIVWIINLYNTFSNIYIKDNIDSIMPTELDQFSGIKKVSQTVAEIESDIVFLLSAHEQNNISKRIKSLEKNISNLERQISNLGYAISVELRHTTLKQTNNQLQINYANMRIKMNNFVLLVKSFITIYEKNGAVSGEMFYKTQIKSVLGELTNILIALEQGIIKNISDKGQEISNEIRNTTIISLLITSSAFLFAITIGYIISISISKRLKVLASLLSDVGNGNFERRAEIKYNDEIGSLSESFNKMIDRLKSTHENLMNSQRQLQMLSTHLQTAIEEERINIAREVHDEIGQVLTVLKIDLSMLKNNLTQSKSLSMINTILETTDNAIKSVQKISFELRPTTLDNLGIADTIKLQVAQLQNRMNINCSTIIAPRDIEINNALSTIIYRVFQEGITNIIRHSKATRVRVKLLKQDNALELVLSDNGVGISKDKLNCIESFGLLGMKERIRAVSGSLDIRGIKGIGTTIKLVVALTEV